MQLGHLIKATALCAVAFYFSGCSSTSSIPKPTEGYKPIEYSSTTSVISVPVAISERVLNAKINEEISGLLYEDNDMDDDNLMVKVWKVQPIQVQLNGLSIDYRVPLKLWVKGGVTKLGITVAKDVELQIALKYRTAIGVTPDWNVTSKTASTGYEWISNPSVSLVGFKVPVKAIADKVVNSLQGKVCSEIDGQIAKQFNLKAMMSEAWQQIQRPILIDRSYNVWLKLTPTEITATPFATRNGIITSALGVKSQTEVLVSPTAPAYNATVKLPNFRIVQKPDSYFSFNILSDIPYTEAEQLAIKEVQGRTFEAGNKKVTVNSLQLYGSNGKVVVGVNLTGSFNGTVYFAGVPVYNKEKKAVEVVDLDFEMQTRNILMKSAAWLFKSTIRETLKENMCVPITSYIEDARKLANSNLKNNHAVKNISINGVVDQIDIGGIYLAEKSFKVLGVAKGKLNVSLEGLNF